MIVKALVIIWNYRFNELKEFAYSFLICWLSGRPRLQCFENELYFVAELSHIVLFYWWTNQWCDISLYLNILWEVGRHFLKQLNAGWTAVYNYFLSMYPYKSWMLSSIQSQWTQYFRYVHYTSWSIEHWRDDDKLHSEGGQFWFVAVLAPHWRMTILGLSNPTLPWLFFKIKHWCTHYTHIKELLAFKFTKQ